MNKVFDFNEPITGENCYSLVDGGNGKLYGTTRKGAFHNSGVLFSIDLSDYGYKKILNFDSSTYGAIGSTLINAQNGNIYGLTEIGGSNKNHKGAIFEFNQSTVNYTILYEFTDSAQGLYPSDIMQASNGLIYGFTDIGGSNNEGTFFSYDPINDIFIKLRDLNKSSGFAPFKAPTEGADSILYGSQNTNGLNNSGFLYKYDPVLDSLDTLANFGPTSSSNRTSKIKLASNNKFYGVCSETGIWDAGIFYEYDYVNSSFRVILNYSNINDENGYDPRGVFHTANGQVYAMSGKGGDALRGTLLNYDITADTVKKILNFHDYSTGDDPVGELAIGKDGKLYGLCYGGKGFDRNGLIFSIDPITEEYKMEYLFGTNQGDPVYMWAGFANGNDGLLYSTSKDGIIFSWDPIKDEFRKRYEVPDSLGRRIREPMMQADNGKFYGSAARGGKYGLGSLFEFDPVTDSFKVLKHFKSYPEGCCLSVQLVQVGPHLYGTLDGGVNDYGIIYKYNIETDEFIKLLDFDFTNNGAYPWNGMIKARNGLLYGITPDGGANDRGVIFSYNTVTDQYIKLVDLDNETGTKGGGPLSELVQASNGKLYGVNALYGDHNMGTLFEYDIEKDLYTKKLDFNGKNGKLPLGGIIEINGKFVGIQENQTPEKLTLFPNPSRNQLTISGVESISDLRVINVQGQTVFFLPSISSNMTIDISTIPPGIYSVEGISNGGKVNEKFVKM